MLMLLEYITDYQDSSPSKSNDLIALYSRSCHDLPALVTLSIKPIRDLFVLYQRVERSSPDLIAL